MFIGIRIRGRETSMWETLIRCLPTRDQAPVLGICPDWESDPQPCNVWMTLQPAEPPSQSTFLAFKKCYDPAFISG